MLQIGRKIYYELATGNVLVDTGERQGSVVASTQDQDFAMYTALAGRVQSSVGVIQLAFGDLADQFANSTGYHVDLPTSTIIFNIPAPQDPVVVAKQRRTDYINQSRAAALETFQSSALSTPHTYLSRANSSPNDMLLLNGEYTFVTGPNYDNSSPLWYTVEAGNVAHTKAQIIQVFLDARTNVSNQMYKAANLIGQINALSDVASINAITW